MKKVLILIPDGSGIRNFLHSTILEKLDTSKLKVAVWANKTILKTGLNNSIERLELLKLKPNTALGEIYKRAWQKSQLMYQAKNFNNPVYLKYIFPAKVRTLNQWIKQSIENYLIKNANTPQKIYNLKKKYLKEATKTTYYKEVYEQLKNEQPTLLLSSIQRSSEVIAPIEAAKKLGIKTACFVFSWDNMPKAMLLVETDYYFVWSQYMKKELVSYHPEINEQQIIIVGTPQFEIYFQENNKISKPFFAEKYNLPLQKKWVCYSGDDISTSPFDEYYLQDFINAIIEWNKNNNEQLHIIFRRCPVDFSTRYDATLKKHSDIITAINPEWETNSTNAEWNLILPKKEDAVLLSNLILHTEFVVNLGSTMAHDFAMQNKPCIYLNYLLPNNNWNINAIYDFLHFKSMPTKNEVIWINDSANWQQVIHQALYNADEIVTNCKKWTQVICENPYNQASERMANAIHKML